ncbi:MAG: hypothetical protein EOO24_22895, partial [Comamonadaceae bacterium]
MAVRRARQHFERAQDVQGRHHREHEHADAGLVLQGHLATLPAAGRADRTKCCRFMTTRSAGAGRCLEMRAGSPAAQRHEGKTGRQGATSGIHQRCVMTERREFIRLVGAALMGQPLASLAQNREPGVVRLLVGFPPGATGDRIARAVAPLLAAALRSAVIVENKPGAGGQLAIEYAKAAPADGTVLLQTIGSSMVIYPHTYRNLRYNPMADFVPVGTIATAPIAFVAAANVPATSIAEAVAVIRKERNLGFYGSPAAGSVFHFSGVLMQRAMGSEFTHVAYKGSAPLLTDVLSGQVPFAFMAPSDILEHHRAGKL